MPPPLPSPEALELLCWSQQLVILIDTTLQNLGGWPIATSDSQKSEPVQQAEYNTFPYVPYSTLCMGLGVASAVGVIDLGALLAPGVPRVLALALMVFMTRAPLQPLWKVRGLLRDYVMLQGSAFTFGACVWPELVELPYRAWVFLGSAGSYIALFAAMTIRQKRLTGQSPPHRDKLQK